MAVPPVVIKLAVRLGSRFLQTKAGRALIGALLVLVLLVGGSTAWFLTVVPVKVSLSVLQAAGIAAQSCSPLGGGGGSPGSVSAGPVPAIAGLTEKQARNAQTIAAVAIELGMGDRAAEIGVATALQESDLGQDPKSEQPDSNLDVSLFQQRIKVGWYGGQRSRAENTKWLLDPKNATRVFFEGHTLTAEEIQWAEAAGDEPAGPAGYTIPGLKQVAGWETKPLTVAAQTVQGSNFPDAYAKHEQRAKAILAAVKPSLTQTVTSGVAPAAPAPAAPAPDAQQPPGGSVSLGWPVPTPEKYKGTPFGRKGALWSSGYHTGTDWTAPLGEKVYAITDGIILNGDGDAGGGVEQSFSGQNGWAGPHYVAQAVGDKGKVIYAHLLRATPGLKAGQMVRKGDVIGYVGNLGNVSGPHLHLQYMENNQPVDIMPMLQAGATVPTGGQAAADLAREERRCGEAQQPSITAARQGTQGGNPQGCAPLPRLTAATENVHQYLCKTYPIKDIGGFRDDANAQEHAKGKALDAMTNDPKLGWDLAKDIQARAAELKVSQVIYQQRIWTTQRASEGWRFMPDRGDPTSNHLDHVHVTVAE